MALAIRMSRKGRKNLAYYHIVVSDKRMARDSGRFLERLGTYNPLLPQSNERRVVLNKERIQYWLSQGAKPSHRVAIFLHQAGMGEKPEIHETPKKSAPKTKTVERLKEKEAKKLAAAESAKAAAEAPAPVPVEEAPAAEAPAAEAPAAETPTAEEPKAE